VHLNALELWAMDIEAQSAPAVARGIWYVQAAGPTQTFVYASVLCWWGGLDSNQRPTDYESAALTD
jgi:hypothetical protein